MNKETRNRLNYWRGKEAQERFNVEVGCELISSVSCAVTRAMYDIVVAERLRM